MLTVESHTCLGCMSDRRRSRRITLPPLVFDIYRTADLRTALAVCLQRKHADKVFQPLGHAAKMAYKAVEIFCYTCDQTVRIFACVFVCPNLQLDVFSENRQIPHAAEIGARVLIANVTAEQTLVGMDVGVQLDYDFIEAFDCISDLQVVYGYFRMNPIFPCKRFFGGDF